MRSTNSNRFAKRSLGQNFLVDDNIVSRIFNAVPNAEQRLIIEIGPGRGALSDNLIRASRRYLAIEKDTELASRLKALFADQSKVRVVESDVLEFDFGEISVEEGELLPFVVANLPYNISTPVLRKLAQYSSRLAGAVLMLQKEVVDRLSAPPGDRNRGFLTVLTEMSFECRKLFEVPPSAFRPRPKVMSAVIEAKSIPSRTRPDNFEKLLSVGFSQPRKKLVNNLKALGMRSHLNSWLNETAVSENVRPAEMNLDEWLSLVTYLNSVEAFAGDE